MKTLSASIYAAAMAFSMRPHGEKEDHEPKDEQEEEGGKQGAAELNAPQMNDKAEVTNKAISSAKQAHSMAKALKKTAMEGQGRLTLCGTVAELYGGATPYKQRLLDESGQNWRANFSSGFLPSIVDRVTPQLRDPIYRADTLTHASLDDYSQDSATKSRKARDRITRLIRSWRGWNDFISLLAQDVVLYGSATPGRVSQDWRPRLFRPDQCYLFERSEQHASRLQATVFWEPVMIHDFLEVLRDKEAAKAAGYDIDGCIKAVNTTGGAPNNSEQTPLEEQDIIREKGNLQSAAENQGRVINLFHVFVREYDGKLALWTTSEEGGHLVRHVEDCEEDMDMETLEDCISLFTLQVGNGKFYGSKGLGRMLANIHIAVERGRCLAIDQNYLAGLPILTTESTESDSMQIVVQHPFIIIKGKAQVEKTSVSFSSSDWKQLDDMLSALAEGVAGSFIPPNLNTGGSSNTKIEAAQKADREVAVRQGVLGRFFSQFSDLVGMMKRAILSPDNLKEGLRIFEDNEKKKAKGIRTWPAKLIKLIKKVLGKDPEKAQSQDESKLGDPEAVCAIVDLLTDGLTIEDLIAFREAADGHDVQGSTAEQDGKTLEFIGNNAQNPFINKRKATEMSAKIAVGEERAKELINKEQHDPLDIAIASRDQLQEWVAMVSGEPQAVASTDIHKIHRETLAPKIGQMMQILQQSIATNAPLDPAMMLTAQMAVDHYSQHIAMDMDSTDEIKGQEGINVQTWSALIKQGLNVMKKQMADRERENQQAAAAQAQGALPPDPKTEIEKGKLALDAERLALDKQTAEHSQRMDVLKFSKEVADDKTKAAMDGIAAAEDQARLETERLDSEKQAQLDREQAQQKPAAEA